MSFLFFLRLSLTIGQVKNFSVVNNFRCGSAESISHLIFSRIRSNKISLFLITCWMPSWLMSSQCIPAVTTTLVFKTAANTSDMALANSSSLWLRKQITEAVALMASGSLRLGRGCAADIR